MPIRLASSDDYYHVGVMCFQFLNNSPYKDYANANKVWSMLSDTNSRVIFVDNDLHGMLIGRIVPFTYGTVRMAVEEAWWVDPEYRKTGLGKELLDEFESWARNQGADLITMICLDDELGSYYEKRGYALCERAYMKEL